MRGFTDIQRTAMFYVQVKISYGSDMRSFGCNKKSLSSDHLEQVEKRLERVVNENKDFENLINVYYRPKALFYCDQTYHKTEYFYDAVFT